MNVWVIHEAYDGEIHDFVGIAANEERIVDALQHWIADHQRALGVQHKVEVVVTPKGDDALAFKAETPCWEYEFTAVLRELVSV